MLFCAPIIGLWYWCTDQYIVQRTLIAPNETEARRGTIFAAFLKLLPVFIFIIPGMIALALAKSGKMPALGVLVDADGNTVNAAAQAAFPLMVQHVLPVGVRGMVVAGLLAALMSSLAGAFNASSTLFTMDFYRKFKPQCVAGRAGVDGPHGDDGDGADRAAVDPGDSGRARPVRLPAGRPGLSGAADLRRVLLRRVQQAAQRGGLPVGAGGRLR